jgi:hypothetical protein
MKQAIVSMIREMVSEGLFLQKHTPYQGTSDIDISEAINAVIGSYESNLSLIGHSVIFHDTGVTITIEDPDDHNADINNHCTGI